MINLDKIEEVAKHSATILCGICAMMNNETCQYSDYGCKECKWNSLDNCINFLKQEYKPKSIKKYQKVLIMYVKKKFSYDWKDFLNYSDMLKDLNEINAIDDCFMSLTFEDIEELEVIEND